MRPPLKSLVASVYGAFFFCKKGDEIFPAQKTAVKAHNPAPVTDLFHLITGTVNCKKWQIINPAQKIVKKVQFTAP